MTTEHGVFAFRRRVLLVEDLALPAAVGRGIGAKVIEEGVAAEDAAVQQQHDARQAGFDSVERAKPDGIEPVDNAALPDGADRWQRLVVEPRQLGPEQGAGPRRGAAFKTNLVALQSAPHADGGDVGVHQRLVVGIVIVALGDDFADNLPAALLIGAEMGKGRIAAQQLAIVHAHDAAAERIVHAILDLVEPVQQRRCPALWNCLAGRHSTAGSPEPAAFSHRLNAA